MTQLRSAMRVGVPMILSYCLLLVLSGCGGNDATSSSSGGAANSSGGSGGSAQTYTLSGTVSDLSSSGLALTVNGVSVTVSSGASSVDLASGLASGATYSVSVATQPTGESCSIAGGTGTIATANVANVVVTCSDRAYALGGTISGLNGSGLLLANGADTVAVPSGATQFTLPTAVAYTSSYAVTVATQPAGLTCAVAQGSGTMAAGDVSDVVVTCTDQPFTVGGSISGLISTGLVLANGSDTLSVPANATSFTMMNPVAFAGSYSVAVRSSPAGVTCSVANGTGTMGAGNVTNISITCSAQSYALGGTISGLTSVGLVLANGADTLSVSANATSFTMNNPVALMGSYSVTVQSNPTGLTCSIANGTGTMGAANVTNIGIICSVNTYTVGGTVSALSRSGLVLLDNGADATTISANASTFTMHTGVAYGATYAISVATQPIGQSCSVAGGTGTIAAADVANVVVTCSDQAYALGGTISGLNGTGLVLANGADTVAVTSGATQFSLPTAVAYGGSYAVTVATQPAGLTCAVAQGSGTMPAGDVSDVVVTCTDQPFTVGGSVSGLGANSGLTLNNGTDTLSVPANATSFTMNNPVAFTDSYSVTVQSSPAGLTCSVANGAGTMGAGNVTNISITCADQSYSLGGSISGLTSAGLMLANGSDTLSVPANATSFTMTSPVAFTGSYSVAVQSNPNGLTCSVANGTGTMGAANVTNIIITCATSTYTVGGTVSGLSRSGLVLLNNATDATAISANATHFSMHTGVANGATYAVSVGTQPYGIDLACTPANASGTVSANVTTVSIGCATVAPVQTAIAGLSLSQPRGVAVDSAGNVYVADTNNNAVKKIPYSNGIYGVPVALGSGFNAPNDVAVDALGNVYVADYGNNAIMKVPYSNGSYGVPVAIGSGFYGPRGVAVDTAGNVYLADTNNNLVKEIPYSNGSYGTPFTLGSGYSNPASVAVDASGNVYVADASNNAIKKIQYSNGSYSTTPVTIGSGFYHPTGVDVDAAGNVYVADSLNNAVKEIPYSNGNYGSPVTLGSGFSNPRGVAVDAASNVYVADTNNTGVKKIPYSNGTYGSPVTIGSGFGGPIGVALDTAGNVYLTDININAVERIPYSNGSYGSPVTIGSGFNQPYGVAVDTAGNVYVADTNNNAVKEIPYSSGSYGSPVTIGSGFAQPYGVAVDAAGNVYVTDTNNNAVKQIPYSSGSYGSPVTLGSGFSQPYGVAVDAADNVYVTDAGNNAVKQIPYSNGSYGAPVTLGSGFGLPFGVAADAAGNVYVADRSNNVVKEIPYSSGNYGSPVTIGVGISSPRGLAVDMNGRLYAIDASTVWMFTP